MNTSSVTHYRYRQPILELWHCTLMLPHIMVQIGLSYYVLHLYRYILIIRSPADRGIALSLYNGRLAVWAMPNGCVISNGHPIDAPYVSLS